MPLIIVGGASVVVMLALTIRRSYALTVWLTLSGLAAAFASLWPAASVTPRHVTLLLVVDRYAIFYMGLILAACFAVVLISYGYFEKQPGQREELYILMLLATLGSQVLVTSTQFVSLFLGLEILSVSLYALIAYQHTKRRPLEAGIKYLVLAASSAAFLLFGMALIYAALGTMQFGEIATHLAYLERPCSSPESASNSGSCRSISGLQTFTRGPPLQYRPILPRFPRAACSPFCSVTSTVPVSLTIAPYTSCSSSSPLPLCSPAIFSR
jgi:NADH:ubiquinone oxidoreductase subunit 2 (subunit N)